MFLSPLQYLELQFKICPETRGGDSTGKLGDFGHYASTCPVGRALLNNRAYNFNSKVIDPEKKVPQTDAMRIDVWQTFKWWTDLIKAQH